MTEYELVGGPCTGKVSMAGNVPEELVFRLDKSGRILLEHERGESQHAFYRRDPEAGVKKYHFESVRKLRVLRGGPLTGNVELMEGPPPFIVEFACGKGSANVAQWFVTYERSSEDELGRIAYDLREQIDVQSDEGKTIAAITNFYKRPDYSIYSKAPGLHKEVLIEEEGRRASVDEGIAELIKAVWKLGLHTLASCQERPAGETHAGKAYISFPLKRHAEAFIQILGQAGIGCEHKETPSQLGQRNQAGESIGSCEVRGLSVYFEPGQIGRIVVVLEDKTRWSSG